MHKFNRVVMVGLGYIGLPTATILANHGVTVIGVDINQDAVRTINRGEIHIVEPDLEGLVRHVVTKGSLVAKITPEIADAFIIAVPTPFKDEHKPDLSYIKSAVTSIAPYLLKGNLVILESTSPVGTTELMSKWLAEARPDLSFPHQVGEDADIQLAYCPERVLPGHIVRELVENDRIIGGMTKLAGKMAADFYRIFVKGECIVTNSRTAEMCKLTENSFRDVNIAFANELSLICDELDLNVWELIGLANRHPRVNILQPGPGVGGHCIAVDPWFIVDSAPSTSKLIRTAREVNDAKPLSVIRQIKNEAARFENPSIACLGLSFKADIDDLRESPALEIVQALAQENVGNLFVVEPHISELPDGLNMYGNIRLVSLDDALLQSDVVVVLVNHQQFSSIDITQLKMKKVIDTRGMFELQGLWLR